MNLELRAVIVEANLGVEDINGYKYNHHKLRVNKLDSIDCYTQVFDDVCVGDCIVTTDWKLTCYDTKAKPIDVVIRIDTFELVQSEGFEPSNYLNSKVTGLYCISDKCVLRTKGPDKVPFFTATIKVKNEFDNSFEMFLLGFRNLAKAMSTVKRQSIVECTVTVKRRRNGNGWEFPISSIEVKAEAK